MKRPPLGREQVWICELGRHTTDGPFEEFVARIAAAPLAFAGLSLRYESPSQERLELGWGEPFRRNGCIVPLGDLPRYDTPWCQAGFPSDEVVVRCGGHGVDLVWPEAKRVVTGSGTDSS